MTPGAYWLKEAGDDEWWLVQVAADRFNGPAAIVMWPGSDSTVKLDALVNAEWLPIAEPSA